MKANWFAWAILFPSVFLLQGCVGTIMSSAVAYGTAIEAQEHAAYTDYLFETTAMNAALQHSGEPSHPIMPKDEWLAEIYRPRIEYAKYYVRYTKSKSPTTPLIPYEAWKETEYKKLIANEKEASKSRR